MAVPVDLKSTDAGAPALNGQNGSASAVLKWALPQLGWTIVAEDGNRTLFRQGGGPQIYLRIIDDSTIHGSTPAAFASDILSAAVNIDSARDAPSSGYWLANKSSSANATERPWRIVGSNQFFYFFIDGGTRTPLRYSGNPFGTGAPFLPGDTEHFVAPGSASIFANTSATSNPMQSIGRDNPTIGNHLGMLNAAGSPSNACGLFSFAPNTGATCGISGPTVNASVGRSWATPVIAMSGTGNPGNPRAMLPGIFAPNGDFREEDGSFSLSTPFGLRTVEIIKMNRTQGVVSTSNDRIVFLDATGDWDDYYV